MRLQRTDRERLGDAPLSLVLLDRCAQEDGVVGDRLKVAKLTFLPTHKMYTEQVKAFNFSFYRYTHGPFTRELYETWGELEWMGFLEIQPGPRGNIIVTEQGGQAAKRYRTWLLELGNGRVLEELERTADSYSQLSTSELLRKVYELQVLAVGWSHKVRIRELPANAYLTCALETEEARDSAHLDDSIVGDFFSQIPRAERPGDITDAIHQQIYAAAAKGTRAAKAGVETSEVSWDELKRKLEDEG